MIHDDEKDEFLKAMASVVPLKKMARVDLQKKTMVQKRPALPKDPSLPPVNFFFHDYQVEPVAGDARLFFKRKALSAQTEKSLRSGNMRIEKTLDLHCLNIEQSREAVSRFLDEAYQSHCRCVRLIHGVSHRQGKATLKSYIAAWLIQYPHLLAYSTCIPAHGGSGAMLVLLEKHIKSIGEA